MKRLTTAASAAEAAHDTTQALSLWREALDLLPPETTEYGRILERVSTLNERATSNGRQAEAAQTRAKYGKYGPIVSAIAVFLVKFKFLLLLVLTKGKLLLLGLTKLSTLSTMALFLGFDARLIGWPLALGVVLSIYVHEMGHVAALHRHGIKASSPMFLPGLGAFIRAQQHIHGEWAAADVGLAGPLWGAGAAIIAYTVYRATGTTYWATLAGWGALINLFNLIPVWQLDAAHAFKAMSRQHRIVVTFVLLVAALLSGERMLWLPFMGAAWAIFQPPAMRADVRALGYYLLLVSALSLIARICHFPGYR